VCCNVLQCVSCWRPIRMIHSALLVLLQCVLQCVAVSCNMLQFVAVCCSVLQCVVACCSVRCSVLAVSNLSAQYAQHRQYCCSIV